MKTTIPSNLDSDKPTLSCAGQAFQPADPPDFPVPFSRTLNREVACTVRPLACAVFLWAFLGLGISQPVLAQGYLQTNLVSDVPGKAALTDTNLMGAWGVVRSATSPWWVNS